MFTYFISDLHLTGDRPDIISIFLEFLRGEAAQAEALYILGDLFEVWIGDDAIPSEVEPVITGLASLTANGVPVFVMVGNRDFLMGKKFEQLSGCTLISDPTKIDLYGKPTLLMHGDTLCTDDVDYQQFREMVRDPAWQADFLAKPVEERIAISKQKRQESIASTKEKSDEIMDVNLQTVEKAFRQHGIRQIIHGHTHRPAVHEHIVDSKTVKRIVLGDWYSQSSWLKVDADNYQLTPTR